MPEIEIPPTAGRLEALRSYAEKIDIRLFLNDVTLDANTGVNSFAEANFPGYAPQRSENWSRGEDPAYPGSVIREAKFKWQTTAAAPGQIVKGWFATVRFPDNSIRLLAAHILSKPVRMEAAGAGMLLDVAIKAYEKG